MSKVICEVCGTAYPENAVQCPICGCGKNGAAADAEAGETVDSGYTPVKGGRFSKTNVRKRNQAGAAVPAYKPEPPQEDEEEEQEKGGNRGLIAAVILLLLAIVAVTIYIFLRFFSPGTDKPKPTDPAGTTLPTQTVDTTPTDPTIPCTGIELEQTWVELDKVGRAVLLNAAAVPSDTTDKITYATSDKDVAAVTAEGRVVAVGPGEAVITITCGDVVKECIVQCNFNGYEGTKPATEPTDPVDPTQPTEKPTDPTQPTEKPTEPTKPTEPEPESRIKLNRTDFSMFAAGDSWKLYAGEVNMEDVTFSSDDESVATFVDGKVVAVGPGTTKVHVEYEGETQTCIVRCKFTGSLKPTDPTEPTETPEEPEDPDEQVTYAIHINGSPVGGTAVFPMDDDTLTITLVGSNGKTVDVTWTSSNTETCTVSGSTITKVVEGDTTLSAVYEGTTYSVTVSIDGGDISG